MGRVCVVAVLLLALAARAAAPSKEECSKAFKSEKKQMDQCVESRCRKYSNQDMAKFQVCFDGCAGERSATFRACYEALIADVEGGQ